MAIRTVVLDANTLYPAPLRDLLMHLAVSDLFRARWTEAIHEKWIRNLLAKRPDLSADRLAITRQRMNAHVRDCLVTGYEELIAGLTLPDPGDRHVLAAAIHCGADAILTFNGTDFPASTLKSHDLEAIHPDPLLVTMLDENPSGVCEAIRRQRSHLRNSPYSAEALVTVFHQQGLPEFSQRLQPLLELI